ncbi:MAG TPA: flagellar biosynthesis protein FlhB [Desulfotomaculum sp.]|nr:MAG: Flagellar biosynthetic protein FlhB [Desulfotomaculum sp. 46_80]HAG11560.1 flagellar biosynthesis protein FlhB [Desulfotomaculum sp.]HBY03736.1 flagellar biosynthesis protein FlhB [Desulfotomaculum sp.]
MSDTHDKTEKATPRKLQESRQSGQVAKSSDLNAALILLFMASFIWLTRGLFLNNMSGFLAGFFEHVLSTQGAGTDFIQFFVRTLLRTSFILLPYLAVPLIIAIGANLLQVGFLFSPGVLLPKAERLNPFNGFKKVFSMRGFFELAKTLLKISIIGFVIYRLVRNQLPDLIELFRCGTRETVMTIASFGTLILLYGGIIYFILAIIDYIYQRYQHDKNLRMSKYEIKEEMRQTEGDPLIKSQIRRRQRQIAFNLIKQEVPKATVVITNPTHFAVALLYKDKEMDVPEITAKGAGEIALQIKKLARENNVPLVENKELAKFLYYKVEIGEKIPVALYQVVAEIIAHVYRLKGRTA